MYHLPKLLQDFNTSLICLCVAQMILIEIDHSSTLPDATAIKSFRSYITVVVVTILHFTLTSSSLLWFRRIPNHLDSSIYWHLCTSVILNYPQDWSVSPWPELKPVVLIRHTFRCRSVTIVLLMPNMSPLALSETNSTRPLMLSCYHLKRPRFQSYLIHFLWGILARNWYCTSLFTYSSSVLTLPTWFPKASLIRLRAPILTWFSEGFHNTPESTNTKWFPKAFLIRLRARLPTWFSKAYMGSPP
jgi:hypothetical protein